MLRRLAWLLGMVVSALTAVALAVSGCPSELAAGGLTLYHILAIFICGGVAIHCAKEFFKPGYYSPPPG